MEPIHTPVLLNEITQYLIPPAKDGFLVDATLGEGGHSEAFLALYPFLCIAGLDADEEIQNKAKERLGSYGKRIRFFRRWAGDFFASYPEELPLPDLILFDLGISMFHYNASLRGFSFLRDEYLDMRLDLSEGKTAADLINTLSKEDLANILYKNAEERYSRRIAAAIKRNAPVTTTSALAEIVTASVPAAYRHGPIHPATRTFQALRMAVNGEAEKLPAMLISALRVLKKGGRMGVVSFHSGEDRVVKNLFRNLGNRETNSVRILTRKPVIAGEEERKKNPPSRSAKFRVVEKINETGVEV